MNHRHFRHALALSLLALAVLAVYARVLFTPLVPASGDFVAYFVPYWQQLNEALRAARLPLWNDHIFGGAPFLANPQTEVFYPLRWPMVLLSAEKGILVSDALHAWLAGALGYFLVEWMLSRGRKREDKAPWMAGLASGLLLALNGWATGLILHPNQFSVYPWLIAAIWLWEARPRPGAWPRWDRATRRWLVGMTLVWAMAFLAGHTQSFYNAVIVFGLWVLGDVAWGGRRNRIADAWPLALAALALTGLLVAVQALPTLELSALSYRQGGLPYRDHAALSLPPWRLGFTLLPHYARDLGMALGTEAYGEWVGYVGVVGLALALLGLRHPNRRLRRLGLFLTLTGLFLAFGAYGLVDIALYHLMPGWDLFRAPARFLVAVMLGVAMLAGLGVDGLMRGQRFRLEKRSERLLMGAILATGLILAALTRPNPPTLLGWLAALLIIVGILWKRPSPHGMFPALILTLFLELYLASYVLPIQHPTAPQALRSWRTAPARIAAEMGPEPRAGTCRSLSLSPVTWDPGDLGDLQRIYGPYLDDWAFTDLVNATKAKEVLAPNLGMVFDIPSLDGFGGGVLPTARFVQAMGLFLPPDQVVADGRLREQLSRIPDANLLSLFNVCYVIAGKNFDVWHHDIYYDLAFGELLDAAHPRLTLTQMPRFPASGVGVVSHLGPEAASLPPKTPVARVIARFADGSETALVMRAGVETAVGEDDARPPAQHDLPAVRWPYHAAGQDVIAELDFPAERLPSRLSDRRLTLVRFELLREDVSLFVRGMAVYDRASAAHATPIVARAAWRRVHSGDVKIYRNDGALPRAFAVERVIQVDSLDAARDVMQAEDFDPRRVAVIDSPAQIPVALAPAQADVLSHEPGRVRLRYRSAGDAFLILADAWHPGWQAILDPDSAAQSLDILPANLFLRGVLAPAGEHELLYIFEPRSLQLGGVISLITLAGLAALAVYGR
ncbi:MAG TPA: hypothetical protein G4O05_05680 [Caldilineae bacterium]|nr:hypothetical protein [Caldilineae bacterium]